MFHVMYMLINYLNTEPRSLMNTMMIERRRLSVRCFIEYNEDNLDKLFPIQSKQGSWSEVVPSAVSSETSLGHALCPLPFILLNDWRCI